jgi:hypothetical protein
VKESGEILISTAAAMADHGGPMAHGQGVKREGRVTASFIGDSRACKYPVDRRGTSVCARPDDGRWTGGPRRATGDGAA